MTRLKDILNIYASRLQQNYWVVFWKEGENWKGYTFDLHNVGLKNTLKSIQEKDFKAVVINGEVLDCVDDDFDANSAAETIEIAYHKRLCDISYFLSILEERISNPAEIVKIMEKELQKLSELSEDLNTFKSENYVEEKCMIVEQMTKIARYLTYEQKW